MSNNDFLTRISDYTKETEIEIDKLFLDPNNPRFMSLRRRKIKPDKYLTDTTITSTRKLMMDPKNGFDIAGMCSDFLAKGFIDGDEIIVVKLDDFDGYVVREGNRRITAIKELLSDERREATEKTRPGLCKELAVIPVTEVLQKDLTPEQVDQIIDQMLGIRHLNQCKQWPPYARGVSLYKKYLEYEKPQTKETFSWDDERGEGVAKNFLEGLDPSLRDLIPKKGRRKISQDNTKNVLKTIRVMEQLDDIKGTFINKQYYSLLEELCVGATAQLRDLLPIDENTFHLTWDSVEKVIDLCSLRSEKREGAAIHNPQQWRYLSRILDKTENEPELIQTMLNKVMSGDSPEDVWAEREATRHTFSWATWLTELATLLTSSRMENVPIKSPRTKDVVLQMWAVLDELEARRGEI
ncbi:MAG: hypothetical protein CL402_01755 [Acidiferrobacteraceae bacterium]|nr:hypothetical protein [Acidiferrobacteraceae bacterium]|tara:strand:- start:286 stop:1515 length:1230 start_codon:yes stop_codon:yes gene_type:complete